MDEKTIHIQLPLHYEKMDSKDKTFKKTYDKELKNSEVAIWYKVFNALKHIMKWVVVFYVLMILVRGIYEAFWLSVPMTPRIITTLLVTLMSVFIIKALIMNSIRLFDKALMLNIQPIKYQGNLQIRYIMQTWIYAIIQSFIAFVVIPVGVEIAKISNEGDINGYVVMFFAIIGTIIAYFLPTILFRMNQIFVGAFVYIINVFYDGIYKKKQETHTLVQDYLGVLDVLNTLVISQQDGTKHMYDYIHELKTDELYLKHIPENATIITVQEQMKSKDNSLLEGQLTLKEARIKFVKLDKEGA